MRVWKKKKALLNVPNVTQNPQLKTKYQHQRLI
jgi:hypothetical protein